jgi:alpha-tubulin suppressor-like RCC1 family protein
VSGPDGDVVAGFSRVVARARYTCAIHAGAAYCWGDNATGQLGDGTLQDRFVPTPVALPAGTLQDLAVGELDACAIVDGALYCWGAAFDPLPAQVVLPAAVTSVSLGEDFRCAIAGDTYCWGANDVGQLGDGTQAPRATPTRVQGALHRQLYAGEDHICALKDAGGAECWGHNDDGVLGFGAFTPTNVLLPQPVDPSITTLPSIGGTSACAIESGAVLCWGSNVNGELGDGSGMRSAVPQPVPGLPAARAVCTGGGPNTADATCAVDRVGAIRCWGEGDLGRLGQGTTASSPVPVDVVGLPGPADHTAVGERHACAVLVDGDLWCWGRGNDGELGNGSNTTSLVPVRVLPPT